MKIAKIKKRTWNLNAERERENDLSSKQRFGDLIWTEIKEEKRLKRHRRRRGSKRKKGRGMSWDSSESEWIVKVKNWYTRIDWERDQKLHSLLGDHLRFDLMSDCLSPLFFFLSSCSRSSSLISLTSMPDNAFQTHFYCGWQRDEGEKWISHQRGERGDLAITWCSFQKPIHA